MEAASKNEGAEGLQQRERKTGYVVCTSLVSILLFIASSGHWCVVNTNLYNCQWEFPLLILFL